MQIEIAETITDDNIIAINGNRFVYVSREQKRMTRLKQFLIKRNVCNVLIVRLSQLFIFKLESCKYVLPAKENEIKI